MSKLNFIFFFNTNQDRIWLFIFFINLGKEEKKLKTKNSDIGIGKKIEAKVTLAINNPQQL